MLTSSFAAIGYGHKQQEKPFTEANWTNLKGKDVLPYVKSKTLAEHEAWNFMGRERGGLELAVVNPVGVFGPVLGPDVSTSILIVQRLLEGAVPGCPKIWFGAVDVRDVADLHLRAMTHPEAKGDRFLAVAGDFLSFREIATILKSPHGGVGQEGADDAAAELDCAAGGDARSGGEADCAGAGEAEERDKRACAEAAGVEAAVAGGCRGGDCGEPGEAGTGRGEPEAGSR